MSSHKQHDDSHLLGKILEVLERVLCALNRIERDLSRKTPTPNGISFQENTMLPTAAGNTQVFTGTLVPAGSTYPADATFTVTSNDPAVVPTVDATGLIVTGPLPAGWVESTTTPLAYAYTAASASNPTWSVTATITPSAPVTLPTGITFAQTV